MTRHEYDLDGGTVGSHGSGSTTFHFRRSTAAEWTASDEVLTAGEPGVGTDTGRMKVGNGTSAWSGSSVCGCVVTVPAVTVTDERPLLERARSAVDGYAELAALLRDVKGRAGRLPLLNVHEARGCIIP